MTRALTMAKSLAAEARVGSARGAAGVVLRASRATCLAACLAACGAGHRSGEPTTPERREIVVDEPSVVRAQPARRPGELPALPQALASSPEPFRHGHALATAFLAVQGPGAPPNEDAAHAQWSKQSFAPWLATRSAALQAVVDAFAPARTGTGSERVVAAALIGLGYARLHLQLTSVPPPASVAADAKLTRVYRSALDAQASTFLEQGSAALAHCVQEAAAQTESPYGLWLQLCQEERVALMHRASQARMLAELVQAERKADLIVAEGARPSGPEVCWTPEAQSASADAATAATASATASAAATPAGTTPGGTPSTSPPKTCARREPKAADPIARTPRELRYGLRDAESGVRVSTALADVETMDASPLVEPATRQLLAACFAQHVKTDSAVTVALHASLVVDARGKARSATLTPEPSDAAAKPSPALLRCLQRALLRVAFDCSPDGQETQARVTYCLRRD